MRILIAEDDPKLLKSLVHIFEMNHYAVDGVDNGNDAFDFASSDEYDGLVLDIMMPGMDGVTLLKKLRASGITTPALFLTAKTETYQKIEGLDAGADDYLPKPFSRGGFHKAVLPAEKSKRSTSIWRDTLNGEFACTKCRQRTCFLCRFML